MIAPSASPRSSRKTPGAKTPGGFATPSALPIETRFRRTQVLGLLLIAALILVVALARADAHALFPPGWWRF